jgi:hypothetical protein
MIMVEFTVLDLYHEVRSLNSELETKEEGIEIFWEKNNTNTS